MLLTKRQAAYISANMKDTPHNRVIHELGARLPAFRAKGFRRAVAQFCRDIEDMTDNEINECFPKRRFVPDGYLLAPEDRRIDVFEVIHTHALSDEKRVVYSNLWFALDFYGIGLEVHVVPVEGGPALVPLCDIYYNQLRPCS